ncbi:MAG: hypothetical protein ABW189_09500 [Rickettsiales bacterium]
MPKRHKEAIGKKEDGRVRNRLTVPAFALWAKISLDVAPPKH